MRPTPYVAFEETAAPAEEPVTVAEIKTHARVTLSADDTYLTNLGVAVRRNLEGILAARFVNQTWKATYDGWPEGRALILPAGPATSLTSIVYYDRDGDSATFDSANYVTDLASPLPRAVLKTGSSWPTPADELREANGIEATAVFGYGAAAANVPEEIKHAIKMVVAHLYSRRESHVPKRLDELPHAVRVLLSRHRRWEAVL